MHIPRFTSQQAGDWLLWIFFTGFFAAIVSHAV
jgi:hypothetical protein